MYVLCKHQLGAKIIDINIILTLIMLSVVQYKVKRVDMDVLYTYMATTYCLLYQIG